MKFSYGTHKNTIISDEDKFEDILQMWAEYICLENKRGKIPLIIAGSGTSASQVKVFKEGTVRSEYIEKGLPCLQEMMQKLKNEVMSIDNIDDNEFNNLKRQFDIMTDDMRNVDREWMGRIFTVFEKSKNENIRKIWDNFCNWFFFGCMESHDGSLYGALNASTSKAAEEIGKLYNSVDAICLSANFDDFIRRALPVVGGNKKGVAILEKSHAEGYLKRIRRKDISFDVKTHGYCVLHANGDVFWLTCSGDGEGYCPNTKQKKTAFEDGNIKEKTDLVCRICNSPLVPTMTMPGTYDKDYNTRMIIETIWKYLSPKISAIITVGISCNWDDILLKFILQLMGELDIPLLDINNFSDKANEGCTRLVDTVLNQTCFEACSLNTSAVQGLQLLNKAIKKEIENINIDDENISLVSEYESKLIESLEKHGYIKRLSKVSQLGLKSYWLKTVEKNERWSHSKEVAETARKMYEKLLENSKKKQSCYERILIYTAGLLHDCGHLPFSHLLEDVFEELSWCFKGESSTFKHFHYTKWIVNQLYFDEECELKRILDACGICVEDVLKLIEGRCGITYLDMLINSSLDADKIAYIFNDAEKSKRNLALNKDEFLEKLLTKAFISQEGMVAFDGESAWYAMRLLDERKRMYEELYYDTRIRCLETMAKYIIITYFVQKYNHVELINNNFDLEDNELIEDLGSYHIMAAVDDLYGMINNSPDYFVNLSSSIGDNVKSSIERCMQLILSAKRMIDSEEPDEINILRKMCKQLLGKEVCDCTDQQYELENNMAYVPYKDEQLEKLVDKLSYEQLIAVRKKIMLNYPGTIIIDIYKTVKYFSPSMLRESRKRLDGTECEQVTILVPSGKKEEWKEQENYAQVSLGEYAEEHGISKGRKTIFHVFCIGRDISACEHAISMLKKEMDSIRR